MNQWSGRQDAFLYPPKMDLKMSTKNFWIFSNVDRGAGSVFGKGVAAAVGDGCGVTVGIGVMVAVAVGAVVGVAVGKGSP